MLFRKAILIIHGFAGGTYDIEELANYLEFNRNFDVFQFTLPGHDKNLSKVKYEDWIKDSEEKIEMLINNGYKNIYLIGHSMGGVIATYLATKYREVKKLVLAAPAFHYLNIVNDKLNIKESLKVTSKILGQYKGNEILARFLKLNISAVKELMELIKKYYYTPSSVICPVLMLHGTEDHIVPRSSTKYVYDELTKNTKKLIYVSGVTHDIFKNDRKEELFYIVDDFLKHNTVEGIEEI